MMRELDRMSPAERQRLAARLERFRELSPEQRERVRERVRERARERRARGR
jgi:hypothetical protein